MFNEIWDVFLFLLAMFVVIPAIIYFYAGMFSAGVYRSRFDYDKKHAELLLDYQRRVNKLKMKSTEIKRGN